MDFYSSRTPDHYKLIKGLFIILAVAFAIMAILFFVLSIDLTAKASNGVIVSENVATQYVAPYEAQVKKVFVQEGDLVHEGDTLMILYNEELSSALKKGQSNLLITNKNIAIFQKKIKNLEDRIQQLKKEGSALLKNHRNKKEGKKIEIENLKKQLALLENKLIISRNRINKDQELLKKGAISEKEYDQRYKSFLDESTGLIKLKNETYQQSNNSLDNDYKSIASKQKLSLLDIESSFLEQQKALEEEENKKEQLVFEISKVQKELKKLYILAEFDGHTTKLFNTKNDLNLVTKNKPLLLLSPIKEEKFYANLKVKEEEIKDIKLGQTVHIKFNAYNHYQYGVLKGKVTHIDKEIGGDIKEDGSVDNNTFYILVDILPEEVQKINIQSGLKINGEIILEKVKLYQFVFNSMFRKI